MCHSFSAFPHNIERRVGPGDWLDRGDRHGVVIAGVSAELPTSLVDCAVLCCMHAQLGHSSAQSGVNFSRVYFGNRCALLDRAQELCESGGGRLGSLSQISLRFLWT